MLSHAAVNYQGTEKLPKVLEELLPLYLPLTPTQAG